LLEFLIQHSESTQFNKYKGDYQKFNKEVLHGEDRKSLITAIKGTIDTRFDSITLHESRYRIRHGLGVDV
ncbi:14-3-3 family protein, partial [Fangia hongkongensis]